MIQEAQSKGLVRSNPARALSDNSAMVKNLSVYRGEVEQLLSGELRVLDLTVADISLGLELQRAFGLLTNDSLFLAIARRAAIENLATHDKDFAVGTGFRLFEPTDVTAF